MSESCENCRFWEKGDKQLEISACRRYPPVHAGHPIDDQTELHQWFEFRQPITGHTDWCGEWQADKEVPPSRGEKTLDSLKLEG